MAASHHSPDYDTMTASINPVHILQQFNSEFQRSKREQIDRFLHDQDDLNQRFSEFALNNDEDDNGEAGSGEQPDNDDVESEFNLRLDAFRVRPLSARIGSWALDDDLCVGEDAENNNLVDNQRLEQQQAEEAKRLSLISQTGCHASSSEDEVGQRKQASGGNEAVHQRNRHIHTNQATSTTVMPDQYSKFARNRERSKSRDRQVRPSTSHRNQTPEAPVRKKLQPEGSGGSRVAMRAKSRERTSNSVKTVLQDGGGSHQQHQQQKVAAMDIDPEDKQLVDKVQPKKLLIRRKYRPRTAMGLQQTSRKGSGGDSGTAQTEQTVNLQSQQQQTEEADQKNTDIKTPQVRPVRASAPAGVSRMKKTSWESEYMKRSTYVERQTAIGNSPSLPVGLSTAASTLGGQGSIAAASMAALQPHSQRQQELLASSSISNLAGGNTDLSLRQNLTLRGSDASTMRQSHAFEPGNLRQGQVKSTDPLRQSQNFVTKSESAYRGGHGEDGKNVGTPRSVAGVNVRDKPSHQGTSSRAAGSVSTPRLSNSQGQTTIRTPRSKVATDPLFTLTTRNVNESKTATPKVSGTSKEGGGAYTNPPNSPSRTRKQYLSPTRKPAQPAPHQRKVGLGAPSEGGGALKGTRHISLIKLPQLQGGLGGTKSSRAAPSQPHSELLANSST